MEKEEKASGIVETMDKIAKEVGGPGMHAGECTCALCGREVVLRVGDKDGEFADEESLGEWRISKMCQRCQDEAWGPGGYLEDNDDFDEFEDEDGVS